MAADPLLSHDVYFTLTDNSDEAKAKLVAACKQYLSSHAGTVFFAVGTLAEELDRPVNDLGFDVALHVVFENRAFQDQYQQSPEHVQFLDEYRDNWKQIRVFDSHVQQ